jgi:hypothetical protein
LTQALIDYGLFAAKTLTLLVLLGLFVVAMLRARATGGGPPSDDGRLEVVSLNDRFTDHGRGAQARDPAAQGL